MDKKSKIINYTVAELIDVLKQFSQDLPVLVSGYEGGFEDLLPPKKIKLEHRPNNKYWDGEFDIATKNNDTTIEAVVLERNTRDV